MQRAKKTQRVISWLIELIIKPISAIVDRIKSWSARHGQEPRYMKARPNDGLGKFILVILAVFVLFLIEAMGHIVLPTPP